MVAFQRRQASLSASTTSASRPPSFYQQRRFMINNNKREHLRHYNPLSSALVVCERKSGVVVGRLNQWNYNYNYCYYYSLAGLIYALVSITFFTQLKQHIILISTLSSTRQKYSTNATTTEISSQKRQYPPGLPTGILSRKPDQYFHRLQDRIDEMDPHERCRRYGWTYNENDNNNNKKKNKIFFGSLLADEPWEILEIMAAETRKVFDGMVFIESDRTQSNAPRQLKRVGPEFERILSDMFQTRVIVRTFIDHNSTLIGLERENWQRQSILLGWDELGMGPNDLGYVADTDETMTRDFLNAVKTCHNLPVLNYQHHQCNPRKGARLYAMARIWEGSPDCTYAQRSGHHPSVVVGHCIEGIAITNNNQKGAPRENIYTRLPGYGNDCFFDADKMSPAPLWNPADFRMILCGDQPMARMPKVVVGQQQQEQQQQQQGDDDDDDDDVDPDPNYSRFTGYHLHNFFADFNAIRYKYQTYGHANDGTISQKHLREAFSPLGKIHNDLGFLHACVHNEEDDSGRTRPRVKGGFDALPPYFVPIYLQDEDYREQRHQVMLDKILADDQSVALAAKQQQEKDEQKHHKVIKLDLTQ